MTQFEQITGNLLDRFKSVFEQEAVTLPEVVEQDLPPIEQSPRTFQMHIKETKKFNFDYDPTEIINTEVSH